VTRKSELGELQRAAPPFGGLTATPMTGLSRVFASPGPIYDPEGRGQDWWRFARVLFATGFRAGDLVHNTFSYHFTPAGFMLEGAAQKLGCPVFPAGVGQTDMQVQAIADLKPVAYVGTPSFLRIILDKADEVGADVSSLRKAVVSGEALPPTLRKLLNDRGVVVRQAYASADLGLIAYETPSEEGLVVEEEVLLEIVRPGTGDPVAEGEVGEVVVTSFNPDYPLIRFATGDLSALLPGISPCGRTNVRIRGWLGRADQTTKVKGMFVHPSQVAALVARHGEIGRARLVVDNAGGQDRMTLYCEVAQPSDALQAARGGQHSRAHQAAC
jgi:phenylacetate-CoA ligase